MRKFIGGMVMFCALCLPLGAQENRLPFRPGPAPVIPGPARLPKEISEFLAKLDKLPDRCENAFWWGGAIAAASVILGAEAVLGVLYLLTRQDKR